MIATTTQTSAAPSTSAAPARTSHVPAKQEADTGTGLEGIELPTEAEMAAALAEISPESRTAPANDNDESTTDETDAGEASPEAEPGAELSPEALAEAAAAAASEPTAATTGETAEDSGPAPTDAAAAPKVPEGVQTRINELTAARRSAEEQVATLQSQLASYQARDSGRLEPDVLEAIEDPDTLERQKTQWNQLHRWAAQNLTAPEAKLGEKIYSTEEVGQIFAQTSQLLTESAPKRAAYLAQRAHFDQATAQIYPWAADPKSGDGEFLHRSLQALPELRRLPQGKLIAADSLVGLKLRNAGIKIDDSLIARLKAENARTAKTSAPAKAGSPAPAVRRVPPSAPARPGSMPPRAGHREASQQSALKRVNRGDGSEQAIAASIATLL
jgi:hypothetical protein